MDNISVMKKRSPVIVFILYIVTFSVYLYVWLYKISKELDNTQKVKKDENPALEVLLTLITCNFYYCYWAYKTSKRIQELESNLGLREYQDSWLYVIFSLFNMTIITVPMIQDRLNIISENSSDVEDQ